MLPSSHEGNHLWRGIWFDMWKSPTLAAPLDEGKGTRYQKGRGGKEGEEKEEEKGEEEGLRGTRGRIGMGWEEEGRGERRLLPPLPLRNRISAGAANTQ